jgi:hypothetical protein
LAHPALSQPQLLLPLWPHSWREQQRQGVAATMVVAAAVVLAVVLGRMGRLMMHATALVHQVRVMLTVVDSSGCKMYMPAGSCKLERVQWAESRCGF